MPERITSPRLHTQSRPTDGPPHADEFPTSFAIGSRRTNTPLVTPDQLRDHLALLHAFYKLRSQVEEGKDDRLPKLAKEMEVEGRWVWFVGLAVER